VRHIAQDDLRDGENQTEKETARGAESGDAVKKIGGALCE
jgi:hypothetical protein